jgi:hypothetical protein
MDPREKPWLDPNLPPLPPFDKAEWIQIRMFQAMTPYMSSCESPSTSRKAVPKNI